MTYGIPYKGSKNNLADSILKVLPSGPRFVDLFGGGGAMTHAAYISGKYSHVHYNELDYRVYKLFLFACGQYTKEDIIRAKIPITKKNGLPQYCTIQTFKVFMSYVYFLLVTILNRGLNGMRTTVGELELIEYLVCQK